jgi:hypothetical protein
MKLSLKWPELILSSGIVLALLILTGTGGGARAVLAAWFLLVCTGMSFAPLLDIDSRAFEFAVGVVLSIVVDTLVATVLLLLGVLSVASGLLVLLALSGAGCALQLLEPRPAAETSPAPPWPW